MMLKGLTIAALMLVSVAGEINPVCARISTEDATAILGAAASRTQDPSGCIWQDATHKRTLSVAYGRIRGTFEIARETGAARGKITEEMGLGGPAFSTVPSSHKGDWVALYCLKGFTVLILDLVQPGAVGRLPQMRDVMRKFVPGEAGRL